MTRVVVTGGSGGLGRHVVRDLASQGYDVLNIDLIDNEECETISIDLHEYEKVAPLVAGADAMVHLAANPVPDTDPVTGAGRFSENTITTYNVMLAAANAGIQRVAWASSETVFGYPFENISPRYLPVDDQHPVMPQNSYAISKVVCEEAARRLHDLFGTTFVGLRFSNVHHVNPDSPSSYSLVPGYHHDPTTRSSNLWGYVDARDAAIAARVAIEADLDGAYEVTIAAADTIMDTPSIELIRGVFPGVRILPTLFSYGTLLSIDKARNLLGWKPQFSWRDMVG